MAHEMVVLLVGVAAAGLVFGFIFGYVLSYREDRAQALKVHHTPRTLNRVRIAILRAGIDLDEANRVINQIERANIIFAEKKRF